MSEEKINASVNCPYTVYGYRPIYPVGMRDVGALVPWESRCKDARISGRPVTTSVIPRNGTSDERNSSFLAPPRPSAPLPPSLRRPSVSNGGPPGRICIANERASEQCACHRPREDPETLPPSLSLSPCQAQSTIQSNIADRRRRHSGHSSKSNYRYGAPCWSSNLKPRVCFYSWSRSSSLSAKLKQRHAN